MCCSLLGDFCFVFCYLFWRLFKQVWGPDTWRAERGTSSFLCLWSCLRDPTQPYTRTDLWVYQQQIFTQPLWTSSTSPVIPTETLGILIPAGQTSSEPFWKKSGETEGRETLFWRCFFLLQEMKRQQSRQQRWQVMERALPMRQEAMLALIWSSGCLQASVPLFALGLLIFTPWWLQRYAATSQATCSGRDWLDSSASNVGFCHPAAGPAGLWRGWWCQLEDLEYWVAEMHSWIVVGCEWWTYNSFTRKEE